MPTAVVVAVSFALVTFEAMAVVITPVAHAVVMGLGSISPRVCMLLGHTAAHARTSGATYPSAHHGPGAPAH